jgi:hypothetical protein
MQTAGGHQLIDGHSVHARGPTVLHHARMRTNKVLSTQHLLHEPRRLCVGRFLSCRDCLTHARGTRRGSAAAPSGAFAHLSVLVCVSLSHRTSGPTRRFAFGPSPPCVAATIASADCCVAVVASRNATSLSAATQLSQGQARDGRSIYPPHLRALGPDDIGLQVFMPPRPPCARLVCGSCASGQSFAYGFLPTAPRGAAVAVPLGVPVITAPRGLSPPRHFPNRFRYRLLSASHGASRHAWRT